MKEGSGCCLAVGRCLQDDLLLGGCNRRHSKLNLSEYTNERPWAGLISA